MFYGNFEIILFSSLKVYDIIMNFLFKLCKIIKLEFFELFYIGF